LEEAIIGCGVLLNPETPPEVARRRLSGVNTFQMPNQLAPFLLQLNRYRIRKYLEAGSFLGGTFYIVDSYLRLTQPENEGGTAIDIADRMQDFEAYRAVHPETRFFEMRSLDFVPERTYDLAFLDSDHSYEYLSQEFAHFLPHARLIALHDIVSTHPFCPGTRRFWNEIQHQFPHHEFVEQYPGRSGVMGIGLVETERVVYADPRDQSTPRRTSSAQAHPNNHVAATDAIFGSGAY
jgi:hypothetical protein